MAGCCVEEVARYERRDEGVSGRLGRIRRVASLLRCNSRKRLCDVLKAENDENDQLAVK